MTLNRELLELRVLAAIDRSVAEGVPFRASTSHVHSTWARTFSSLPELYIQPESVREIEQVVDLARQCRRRITTVGCGHSPSTITCTSSWMVNLDNFRRVLSVDSETGLVSVEAGIRLWQLNESLERVGLAISNLGSIDEQSIAGLISTGTHGSSLSHGLMSEQIESLHIVLADGKSRTCSAQQNTELFRAALLSLGALGIITHVTLRTVPAFSLAWTQTIEDEDAVFRGWNEKLWKQAPFVRVWWLPYTRRAVTWQASQADLTVTPHRDPPINYYDAKFGYYVYHNLLWLSRFLQFITPGIEWFVFGMQYGFRNGLSTGAVQPSRKALLLNCLYSQYVNEWALPLDKGPEALRRLGSWLHNLKPGDPKYVDHGIPFSSKGLYVHAPVEVRVSDSTVKTSASRGNRPFLDPTRADGPTLYLNAIMYRPYYQDLPGTDRYYQGFEWLMKDLGGRPHWAKNFSSTAKEIEAAYGDNLLQWRKVRDQSDPEGMFVGPWHRNLVLGGRSQEHERLPLEEDEVDRSKAAAGGGVLWSGRVELVA
jgi:D-arabinono-1,4-lactone oxidase